MSRIKSAFAVLFVLTLLWFVFLGNLLEEEPNFQTWVVFVVGAVSFSVLFILRILSFVACVRAR